MSRTRAEAVAGRCITRLLSHARSRGRADRARQRRQETPVGVPEPVLAAPPRLEAHLQAEPRVRLAPPGHPRPHPRLACPATIETWAPRAPHASAEPRRAAPGTGGSAPAQARSPQHCPGRHEQLARKGNNRRLLAAAAILFDALLEPE